MTFLENPFEMAENCVFKYLCEATGSELKKNAFIGYLPPVGNVWALKIGGGGDVRNTWTAPITELRMDAEIEAIVLSRERAQLFIMKILQALPLMRRDNVQMFRLRQGGMPDIRFRDDIVMPNENEKRFVWSVSIGCEIVFNTVERANVAPNV